MFASDRAYHHPISRNDIIPTPSQPMNSWNMLFAVMMVSIAIRNINRYLINLLMWGSVDMYHIENSVMDHVTNRAMGMKVSDGVSRMKLMLMFVVVVLMIGGVDNMVSLSLFSREVRGIRLIMNVVIRLFFVSSRFGLINSLMMMSVSDRKIARVVVGMMVFIFYYLELRQVFWCLRPTEELLSFSREKAGVLIPGGRFSRSCCLLGV